MDNIFDNENHGKEFENKGYIYDKKLNIFLTSHGIRVLNPEGELRVCQSCFSERTTYNCRMCLDRGVVID